MKATLFLVVLVAVLAIADVADADMLADVNTYVKDSTTGLCKTTLEAKVKADADKIKTDPCKTITDNKAAYTKPVTCSDTDYDGLKKKACDRTATIAAIDKYNDGITDATCKPQLKDTVTANEADIKNDPCKTITDKKAAFTTGGKCEDPEYKGLKKIACDPTATMAAIDTYIDTITDKTCKPALKAKVSADATDIKKDPCNKITDNEADFTTIKTCSDTDYDGLKKIMCATTTKPDDDTTKTIAAMDNYIDKINDATCKTNLQTKVKDDAADIQKDLCKTITDNKADYTTGVTCSEDVYNKLKDIMCDAADKKPDDDTSGKMADLNKYIKTIMEKTCKQALEKKVTDEKAAIKKDPCKTISYNKAAFTTAIKCSEAIYNKLKDKMCDAASLPVFGALTAVACIIMHLVTKLL